MVPACAAGAHEWNSSHWQRIRDATALIQSRNREVTALHTKPEFISARARTCRCTGQHLIETMFYTKTIIKNRLKKKAWFFLFPPVIIIILSCTSDWPLTRGGKKKSLRNRRIQSAVCLREKNTSLSGDTERHVTHGNTGQGAQWAAESRAQAREVKHHSKHELIAAEGGDELKIQTVWGVVEVVRGSLLWGKGHVWYPTCAEQERSFRGQQLQLWAVLILGGI